MKDKQKIHFPQKKKNVHHVDFEYSGCTMSCFVLVWPHSVAIGPPTVRQHRGAGLVEGGVGEDADTKPSPHIEWLGGGVYCREQEARVKRKKEEEEWAGGGRGRGVPVLLHRVAKYVCVSVLTLSKSICPLWNCGHREGKRCPNTTRTHAGRKQQLHQQLALHVPLHGAGGGGGALRQAELMRDLGGWVSKQVEALLHLRGDKLAGQSMSEQKAKNQLKGATL